MAVPAEEYVQIGFRNEMVKRKILHSLGGKQQLIAEKAFDDIDLAMMVHAEAGENRVVTEGKSLGFIAKDIRFIGSAAHAGGAPWDGVNALNAASLAIQAIHSLRETFRDEDQVRVHPIITKGGDTVNTVPADVRMECFVRAGNWSAMIKANEQVNRALRGASYALGAEVEIDDLPGYLPMIQNPEMSRIFAENAKNLLPDVPRFTGLPFSGSTDMGDLAWLMPAIQPTVGGFSGKLHGADFQLSDPELGCIAPAKLMAMTVIDLLADNAAAAKQICAEQPRRETKDYHAMWRSAFEK